MGKPTPEQTAALKEGKPVEAPAKPVIKDAKDAGAEKKGRSKYSEYDFSGIAKLYKNTDEIKNKKEFKNSHQLVAILSWFHGKPKLSRADAEVEMKAMADEKNKDKVGYLKTNQDPIKVFNYYRNRGDLRDNGVGY